MPVYALATIIPVLVTKTYYILINESNLIIELLVLVWWLAFTVEEVMEFLDSSALLSNDLGSLDFDKFQSIEKYKDYRQKRSSIKSNQSQETSHPELVTKISSFGKVQKSTDIDITMVDAAKLKNRRRTTLEDNLVFGAKN